MRACVWIALLGGCAAGANPKATIANHAVRASSNGQLDRLGFLAGCWQEITRYPALEHRFCWSREPARWHGVLVLRARPSEQVTHYFIEESPAGLVLESSRTADRVLASRVEPQAIVFRRPDPPDSRWRGPDLSLEYKPSSHALSVAVLDVLHFFVRAD